jgi:hypothetical protein
MPNRDSKILRLLADEWAVRAHHPVMDERVKAWQNVKDLNAKKPLVYVETNRLVDIIPDNMLQCGDPYFRAIEFKMREALQHVDAVGDDFVLEPVFWIEWDCETSDFGLAVEEIHAQDAGGASIGYKYTYPLFEAKQVEKLKVRTRIYNKESTYRKKAVLEDIFGGVLPVEIRGANRPNGGLTRAAFELLGMENMLCWIYDEPEALKKLLKIIKDDFIFSFDLKEKDGLLSLNTNGSLFASGSPGYCTSLPGKDFDPGNVKTENLWLWMESQETSHVSPPHFKEMFLPMMAEICKDFGLVYYGCCESIDDRFEDIEAAIPNIRAVSISPWNNLDKVKELLGNRYVYSRKVDSSHISGEEPQWDLIKKDLDTTFRTIESQNLEVILRDIYNPFISHDLGRLRRWVEMARAYTGS